VPSKYANAPGLFFACILSLSSAMAQKPQFLPFSEAQPVLNAYSSTLPAELKQPTAAAWDKWVRNQDFQIRTRLERGQEDTLTNLLRLGVTYTKEERISYTYLERFGKDKYVDSLVNKRADDLIRALTAPHPSEGMAEMRGFLEKQNFNLKTPDGQKRVKAYLLANLGRMRDEVIRAESELYKNKNANLSQQFKDRGISTDSNLYPDYMIQLHLQHMIEQGLLKPGSIHRVAIVGPGLDFVNKNSGSDFYPPQTTQPFAVIDTLARLKLADPATVELYTFDISSRVNRHLDKARKDAAAGKWYTIQLLSSPNDQWNKDYAAGFLDYWQNRQASGENPGAGSGARYLEPCRQRASGGRPAGYPRRHERRLPDRSAAHRQAIRFGDRHQHFCLLRRTGAITGARESGNHDQTGRLPDQQ